MSGSDVPFNCMSLIDACHGRGVRARPQSTHSADHTVCTDDNINMMSILSGGRGQPRSVKRASSAPHSPAHPPTRRRTCAASAGVRVRPTPQPAVTIDDEPHIADMFDFGVDTCDHIVAGNHQLLVDIFRALPPLAVESCFSGRGTAEAMVGALKSIAKSKYGTDLRIISGAMIDIDPHCRRVLTAEHSGCVYADVTNFLPPDIQSFLGTLQIDNVDITGDMVRILVRTSLPCDDQPPVLPIPTRVNAPQVHSPTRSTRSPNASDSSSSSSSTSSRSSSTRSSSSSTTDNTCADGHVVSAGASSVVTNTDGTLQDVLATDIDAPHARIDMQKLRSTISCLLFTKSAALKVTIGAAQPCWKLCTNGDMTMDKAIELLAMLYNDEQDTSITLQFSHTVPTSQIAATLFNIPDNVDITRRESLRAAVERGDVVTSSRVHVDIRRCRCERPEHQQCVTSVCNVGVYEPTPDTPCHVIHVAGSPCWDWSANSLRRQQIHGQSMLVLFSWILYIFETEPTVFVHENVPGFWIELLLFFLGSLYTISYTTFSPCQTSNFPVSRDRIYTLGHHRKRATATTPVQHLPTYLAVECKYVAMDLFFGVVNQSAKFQLSPSATKFLAEYRRLHPDLDVFDLNNNPNKRSKKESRDRMLHAITRGCSRIFSCTHSRWLTPPELSIIQGHPIAAWAARRLHMSEPLTTIMEVANVHHNSMVGNSMHGVCIFQMIAWAVVHTQWS